MHFAVDVTTWTNPRGYGRFTRSPRAGEPKAFIVTHAAFEQVDVILHASSGEHDRFGVGDDAPDVAVEAQGEVGVDERFAVLRAEYDVCGEANEGLRHGVSLASAAPLGLKMGGGHDTPGWART
jgi:hypothetical protein